MRNRTFSRPCSDSCGAGGGVSRPDLRECWRGGKASKPALNPDRERSRADGDVRSEQACLRGLPQRVARAGTRKNAAVEHFVPRAWNKTCFTG